MSKRNSTPSLRFRNDSGESWKCQPLSKLATLQTRKNVGSAVTRVLTNSAVHGVVDQRDYFEKDIANSDNLSNYGIIEQGDFVYNPRVSTSAPVGPISRNNLGTGAMSPLYTIFRFHDASTDFYEHFFQSTHWHAYMYQASNVGARHDRMAISTADFKAMPLPVPPECEKQKIANCLSSVDKLIAAQAKKVDALKAHKKGLMQQLFPADGSARPRMCFEHKGDWQLHQLDSLAIRGSGHTPSKSNPSNYNGGIKWVSLADLKHLDAGSIHQTTHELSDTGIKNSSAKLHPAGTVLLSRDAAVGKSAVMGCQMAVSQHFMTWTCKTDHLHNWFLYYLLQHMKPIFEREATGSTIKTIGLPFFKSLNIHAPAVDEQKSVANCIRHADTAIEKAEVRLNTLRSHKRGLMQQLFPSLEAPK